MSLKKSKKNSKKKIDEYDDASSASSSLELMADWYCYLLDWDHLSDDFDTSNLQEMSVTHIIPILLCTDRRNKNIPDNFQAAYLQKNIGEWDILDLERYVTQSLPWDGEDESVVSWWEMNYIQFPKGNFLDFICSANGLNEDLRLRFTRRLSNQPLPSTEKSIIPTSNEDCDNDPKSTDEDSIDNNDDAEDRRNSSEVAMDKAKSVTAHQRIRGHVLPTSSNRMSKLAAHAEAQIYYHSLFFTLKRHGRPEDMSSFYEDFKQLCTTVSKRTKLNPTKHLNSIITNWSSTPRKSSISMIPNLLAHHDNIGDDGLMSQSTFDVAITNEDYLNQLPPNPFLIDNIQPSNDELHQYYSKLLQTYNTMKQKMVHHDTLRAIRKKGEQIDVHVYDCLARDILLAVDDAEFTDWCLHNQYARLWYCPFFDKSALLKLAVQSCIRKSPNPASATKFELMTEDPKFIGFVTAETDKQVIVRFHIHSFVLYYTNDDSTVVICAATSRIHIRSMMQDRLLQFLQLIQFFETNTLNTVITSNFTSEDVKLPSISIEGYNSMGFSTRNLTMDAEQGLFTIQTESLIPIMCYTDKFSWANYGDHILYGGEYNLCSQEVECNPSLTAAYRAALTQLLCVDIHHSISNVLDKESDNKIDLFLRDVFAHIKQAPSGHAFDKCLEDDKDFIFGRVLQIATSATKIPLSIFSDLFRQRFKKKEHLETTLEILQQCYLTLDKAAIEFGSFFGDNNMYRLRCTRCHKNVTHPNYIDNILPIASIAILHHFGILSTVEDFPHLPLLFTTKNSFEGAFNLFKEHMSDISNDFSKDSSISPICCADTRDGMISFCESMKVDFSTAGNHKKEVLTNTLSLVSVVFESFLNFLIQLKKDSPRICSLSN